MAFTEHALDLFIQPAMFGFELAQAPLVVLRVLRVERLKILKQFRYPLWRHYQRLEGQVCHLGVNYVLIHPLGAVGVAKFSAF
ncbi:hypothetical protein VM98_03125 [Streptomyces rubellomurinus subsp. indigoferus]|nr:hypothetical protein VM98_03125 [Streptomyces rubellomurinus subsp. indigoferus]